MHPLTGKTCGNAGCAKPAEVWLRLVTFDGRPGRIKSDPHWLEVCAEHAGSAVTEAVQNRNLLSVRVLSWAPESGR